MITTDNSIAKIEQITIYLELGVTNDFLLTDKECVATEAIPATEADKTLNPDVKKALISLIDELGKNL